MAQPRATSRGWERADATEPLPNYPKPVTEFLNPTREQIAAFLRGYALADIERWQLLPTSANGQPALAGYLWDEQTEAFTPYCLYVLTLRERQIEEITAFVTPETFPTLPSARVDRTLRLRHTCHAGGRGFGPIAPAFQIQIGTAAESPGQ